MIRGCRAALGLVLVWFVLLGALTSTAAADVVPPASEGVVYGYDTAHRAASISPHAHDRDPAINYNRAAARLAVDHDPRGPSARLDAAGTYRYTPYDRSVALALVDSITCTAGRHAGAVDGELSPIQRSGVAANSADEASSLVTRTVADAREWLGPGGRAITNDAGDKIFLSQNGLRRIRVDIKRPYPHEFGHAHVEEFIDGKWVRSGPIYPSDVPGR